MGVIASTAARARLSRAHPITPAFAAKQYWIVQQSTNSCTVVDEKPKSTVGDNKGYGSRAEAERSIKTTKGCTQE